MEKQKNDTKGERAMNSTVSIIIELQTFIFCCTNNYGASFEQGESGIVERGWVMKSQHTHTYYYSHMINLDFCSWKVLGIGIKCGDRAESMT